MNWIPIFILLCGNVLISTKCFELPKSPLLRKWNQSDIPEALISHGQTFISKSIFDVFLEQLFSGRNKPLIKTDQDAFEASTIKIPIPIPQDPIKFPSLSLQIDIPNLLGYEWLGNADFCDPALDGLGLGNNYLQFTADHSDGTFGFDVALEIPLLALNSEYKMELNVTTDFAPEANMYLNGEGNAEVKINGPFLKFIVHAITPAGMETLSVDNVDLDLGFVDGLVLFTNMEMNGEETDLGFLGPLLNTLFEMIWNEATKELIIEPIRCSLDYAINECTLLQLIQRPADCVKLNVNPLCFAPISDKNTSWISAEAQDYCSDKDTEDPNTTKDPSNANIIKTTGLTALLISTFVILLNH